ncbi:MAG TPA: hypothetical protein VMW16_03625 [Sedimentisphaerales bacterium]|nr:hypothetical protein [Sedimentisphaerales bacterium]
MGNYTKKGRILPILTESVKRIKTSQPKRPIFSRRYVRYLPFAYVLTTVATPVKPALTGHLPSGQGFVAQRFARETQQPHFRQRGPNLESGT